ncbi:E3 ubiquitin-protein ligase TM129 isoform X5 [Parambassis ranga]|uniref:E3 ubiquitin-protein ligase TM129 isoform X5 n=1 Tax=Parambassis ranga TaxID=210632 RepID=A0A6P7J442_9TELE|nr:E3 ubiquitin-protein ligase TM129 isoform X5 [Parambassis ranga]
MESSELSLTLAYVVFSVCFVFTPNEFRSAGLTIQNLFSSWLGSEDVNFIQYHVRRTSVTVLVHSVLPLGYYVGMCIAAPEKHLVYINQQVTTYHIYMALQSECHVTVIDSIQHHLSPDSATPTEILTLRVDSINPAVRPFNICVNSTEYAELREKLQAPIRNSPNVVIHQTIGELFLETFRAQVNLNQSYTLPSGQEVEPCIGCMQVPANTKLVRLCQAAGGDIESECQQCFCRPMWCLSCLGRWFASRQDQQRPETWLSSKVPCPTCRAKFCIVDICMVRASNAALIVWTRVLSLAFARSLLVCWMALTSGR